MSPSDADEAHAQDDDRAPPRRRSRRDVLEVGGSRGGGRGGPDHPRDLDEEDDRGDRRGEVRARRDDPERDDSRAERRGPPERRGDVERRGDPERREGGRDRPARRDADDEEDDEGEAGKGRKGKEDDEKRGGKKDQGQKEQGRKEQGQKDDAEQGDGEKATGKDSEESRGRRRSRRPLVLGIAGLVAAVLIAYGVYHYLSHRDLVSTDDAYTDGYIVAVAPRVSGQVVSLDVVDNQFVHKGDALIHIDPRPFMLDRDGAKGRLDSDKAQIANQKLGVEISKKNFPAALQLAQANLLSAKSNLQLQDANNNRQKNLPRQATTQQEVDTTASSYQQAEAQVAQAQARVVQAEPVQQNIGQSESQLGQLTGVAEQDEAQLGQAELNLEFTVVRAQQDGWVTRRNVNAGNYVTSGTQIMSLVTPDIWVTANYKETELDGMRPGQRVRISVDAYPDLDLQGHVDSIQRGSGSRFSAFPAENATGNFVKIVQRVPVKIVIDSGLKPEEPLPLGASVVPVVTLR